MEEPIDIILGKLKHFTSSGKNRWTARCPAHNDGTPSLSVKRLYDGRVLIHCHAGCGSASVLDALGLRYGDLYPDTNKQYDSVVKPMDHDDWILFLAENSTVRLTQRDKEKVKKTKLRALLRENRS